MLAERGKNHYFMSVMSDITNDPELDGIKILLYFMQTWGASLSE